ncbi:auxin efflux carrier [Crucibulum laeve]|uniref:Auxin efflux carrier n=1 Tax=Crucibulum laeve TaxID=68775 RepID=A0A5C3LYB2_9AGAR|nr:auxin efflux carrier [Crucibulum laeve]
MLSVGALIWVSCRPLIRLVLCVACGFVITKADIFPAVAARGAGQIMLNIALPCLMFSKIVPAFTSQNISALGPLVLVAVLYEAIGIGIAWLVGQLFWVPHRFRYGILVAGGWGNVGDIPTSVIMSITAAAPFNGTSDQNLAVAYISAFILVFMVTLFPLGGHRWIAMDYVGPDIETEEVQEAMRRKRQTLLYGWPRVLWRFVHQKKTSREKEPLRDFRQFEKAETRQEEDTNAVTQEKMTAGIKQVAFQDDAATVVPTDGISSPICSPAPTELGLHSRINSIEPIATPNSLHQVQSSTTSDSKTQTILPMTLPTHNGAHESPVTARVVLHRRRKFCATIRNFFKTLLTPASIAIFIAFPIALIPQLKALFVEVPGTNIPPAPDGQPPLAFLIDTTTFIGAASVPLGLICLGSALARLHVPRNQWKTLPIGAITWLAVGKVVVMPVLGVLICEGFLLRVGVISRDDKVIRFVCIFFSCLPTATTQVFLTQVYSGTGSAEHLSAFLIPQYILMFISMTALTAYSIQMIF